MKNRSKKISLPVIFIHAISWIILFELPDLLKPGFDKNWGLILSTYKHQFTIITYCLKVIWIALFYVNAELMIPSFLYQHKYFKYLLSLVISVIAIFYADYILFRILVPRLEFRVLNSISFNFFPILFILVSSSAYKLIVDRIETSRLEKDRLNENLKTELSLLRSQVSPHFMFNILNGMVALARKKSDLLEPSLIKLSQLLRYMLYETEHKVSLSKEIEYLHSYVDLQKQRFGNTISLYSSINVENEELGIEPMLLIPFVENAFKHGVGMIDKPEIVITVTEIKGELNLRVENKFNENTVETKDKTSGIGLENVSRRLDLLYPSKHELAINDTGGRYIVNLKIQL